MRVTGGVKRITVTRRGYNWFSTSDNDSSVTLNWFYYTTQEMVQIKLLILNAAEF